MARKSFNLEVILKAVDRASPVLARTSKAVRRFGDRTGLTGVVQATGQVAAGFRSAIPAATTFGLAAGAAGVGVFAMVKRSAAMADQLAKTSRKLGLGVEGLQQLRYSAGLAGMTTQTLDMSMQRFTRRAAEAAAGTGEAKDALQAMDIQLTDSEGQMRSSEDLLYDVADAMARIEDPSKRIRIAFKLFDSEGVNMVNMLANGSEKMRAQAEELRRLGIVTEEQARKSELFNDQITKFEAVWDDLVMTLSIGVLPAFSEFIAQVRDFGIEHKTAIVDGFKTALEGLAAAGRWGRDAFQAFGEAVGPANAAVLLFLAGAASTTSYLGKLFHALSRLHPAVNLLFTLIVGKLIKSVLGLLSPFYQLVRALFVAGIKMLWLALKGVWYLYKNFGKLRGQIWKTLVALWSWTKAVVLSGVALLRTAGRGFVALLVGLVGVVPMLWKAASASAAWTAALLANPITWIVLAVIAAIAGLVYAGYQLWKNWDKIEAWFAQLWDAIAERVAGAIDAIKQKWEAFKAWLGQAVAALLDLLPDWAKDAFGMGDLNANLTTQAPSAYAGKEGTQAHGRVVVDFQNAPAGMRVRDVRSDSPALGLEADLGFAMVAP